MARPRLLYIRYLAKNAIRGANNTMLNFSLVLLHTENETMRTQRTIFDDSVQLDYFPALQR